MGGKYKKSVEGPVFLEKKKENKKNQPDLLPPPPNGLYKIGPRPLLNGSSPKGPLLAKIFLGVENFFKKKI